MPTEYYYYIVLQSHQVTKKEKLNRFAYLSIICLFFMSFLVPGVMAADSVSAEEKTGVNESVDDLINQNPEALLIYSGAGLKKPVQAIGSAFTNTTGIPVVFNFQGSGNLLTQMDITRKGDVFIPGGTSDFKKGQEKGLVSDYELLAYHVPMIAVQKGNPDNIVKIQDFTQPGLKIGLGDIKATAIGAAGDALFSDLGITADIEKNVVLRAATINELVTAMNAGTIDASLLTKDQIDEKTMDAIPLEGVNDYVLIVPIGVTTFSMQSEKAQQFVDFAASDEGKAFFKKFGFPSYPDEEYKDVQA